VRATLGVLQNLAAVAKLFPGPLGRAEVEQTVAQSGQPTSSAPDVLTIVEKVSAAFDLSATELMSQSRLRGVLRARQVAMYLARELTGLSYPQLAIAFGRDHTTVLHACRKMETEMANDATLSGRVNEVRGALT